MKKNEKDNKFNFQNEVNKIKSVIEEDENENKNSYTKSNDE